MLEVPYPNTFWVVSHKFLAGEHPCPLNRRVYDLVRRMEQRKVPPGVAALEELKV